MTATTTRPTVKETAAAVRAELRATFPGVAFSVRMSRGTGYGWLDITWTDGPVEPAVRAITDPYCSERWNGMDDMYHPTGNTKGSLSGVTHQRRFSPERVAHALTLVKGTGADRYIDADGATVFAAWAHMSDEQIAHGWLHKVAA